MSERDRIRLQHMLDATREALSFAEGKSRSDLMENRMLALSLIGEIVIIGEAATKISAELKQSAASIPWGDIIGMRNRLIHGYDQVNFDVLWRTVQLFLRPLMEQLEALLAEG